MGKRWNRLKYFLIGLLAVSAILGGAYSYLAFRPTGMEDMKRRGAEALKQVEKSIGHSTSGPQTRPSSSPADASMNFFDECRKLTTALKQRNRGYYHSPAQVFFDLGFKPIQHCRPMKAYGANLEPGETLADAVSNPEFQSTHLRRIERSYFHSNLWPSFERAKVEYAGRKKGQTPLANPLKKNLERHEEIRQWLDKAETLLIERQWQGVSFTEFPLQRRNEWAGGSMLNVSAAYDFEWMGVLTVLRAVAKGDHEKAALLTERCLDLRQAISVCSFPSSSDGSHVLHCLLAIAGDWDEFPVDSIERIQTRIASMRIDSGQLEELTAAHAMRVRDTLINELESGALGKQEDSFHFMFDGKLEGVAVQICRPVLKRNIDEMTVAYAEGDFKKCREAKSKVRFWLNRSNYDWNSAPHYKALLDRRTTFSQPLLEAELDRDALLQKANEGIDLAILLAASARFRRAEGRPPDSIAELKPQFLDEGFLAGSAGSLWQISRIEASPTPTDADIVFLDTIFDRFAEKNRPYLGSWDTVWPGAAALLLADTQEEKDEIRKNWSPDYLSGFGYDGRAPKKEEMIFQSEEEFLRFQRLIDRVDEPAALLSRLHTVRVQLSVPHLKAIAKVAEASPEQKKEIERHLGELKKKMDEIEKRGGLWQITSRVFAVPSPTFSQVGVERLKEY